MTAVPDRTAQFSAAVALIYESIVANARHAALEKSLCALLDADELVFTYQRAGPPALLAARGATADNFTGDMRDPPMREMRTASHILSLDIVESGYDKLRLIVVRHPERDAFSDRDLAWLSLLRPHLQNAELARQLLPEGVLGSAASSHFIRMMTEGLIILSATGEIQWLNPSAREILAARQGLSCENGRLHAARAFETARIELLIRDAARGRQGSMLVDHAAMWLPYGLVFVPLEFNVLPEAAVSVETKTRPVLVTIKDMRRHIDIIVARLTLVFGLTKAEQKIGALLLAGHSLGDAAAIMGKSLPTVKKQLRSMLTKTGAHSQAELLSMFLSVPSML